MAETQLFWMIMHILSTTMELMILKFTMDTFSKKKKSELVIVSMLVVSGLITIALNIVSIDMNIKLMIGILSSIIIYLYNYEETKSKILITCSIYWLGLLGMDILSMNIILGIHDIDVANKIYSSKFYYLEMMILAKVLLIVMINTIKNIQIQFRKRLSIRVREIILIAIPILSNVINIVVLYSFRLGLMDNYESKDLILGVSTNLSAISNIALIFIIIKIIKEAELRIENKAIREKVEYQYNHYIQLQNAQLKVRKLYHDMNNHLICIENMNKQNKESKEYIDNLKSQINEWKSIDTTGDMILDIILNEKRTICLNNNIEFCSDIYFKKCDFIEMMDICTIFSNILDNSIEACNKIDTDDKYIKIVGNIVNKFFVIRCENSKVNSISYNKNKIFTDKKDKFLHGLGINNVKDSVEKYNGSVSIDHTEDKFMINIYIPLPSCNEVRQGGIENELIYSNL